MIKEFRDDETAKVFRRERSLRLSFDVQLEAQRKLAMLDAAESLEDLPTAPRNRLAPLTKAREGQHSVGINYQWRVCFTWDGADVNFVEITDYH